MYSFSFVGRMETELEETQQSEDAKEHCMGEALETALNAVEKCAEAVQSSAEIRRQSMEAALGTALEAAKESIAVARQFAVAKGKAMEAAMETVMEEVHESPEVVQQKAEVRQKHLEAVLANVRDVMQAQREAMQQRIQITLELAQNSTTAERQSKEARENCMKALEDARRRMDAQLKATEQRMESLSQSLISPLHTALREQFHNLSDIAAKLVASSIPFALQPAAPPEENYWECPICLDPLTTDSGAVVTMCGHMFHNKPDCLEEILREDFAACPVCRERVRHTIVVYNGIPCHTPAIQGRRTSLNDTEAEETATTEILHREHFAESISTALANI